MTQDRSGPGRNQTGSAEFYGRAAGPQQTPKTGSKKEWRTGRHGKATSDKTIARTAGFGPLYRGEASGRTPSNSTPSDLTATIFDHVGIDPATNYHDGFQRTSQRLCDGTPVREWAA
jgi:hypothetical protein